MKTREIVLKSNVIEPRNHKYMDLGIWNHKSIYLKTHYRSDLDNLDLAFSGISLFEEDECGGSDHDFYGVKDFLGWLGFDSAVGFLVLEFGIEFMMYGIWFG